MYIPAARERVQILGRAGVFFVLAVDLNEQFATVIPLIGAPSYFDDVLFTNLRPYRSDEPLETTEADKLAH